MPVEESVTQSPLESNRTHSSFHECTLQFARHSDLDIGVSQISVSLYHFTCMRVCLAYIINLVTLNDFWMQTKYGIDEQNTTFWYTLSSKFIIIIITIISFYCHLHFDFCHTDYTYQTLGWLVLNDQFVIMCSEVTCYKVLLRNFPDRQCKIGKFRLSLRAVGRNLNPLPPE